MVSVDTNAVIELVGKILEYYRANARPKERRDRMIERLGLKDMDKALGLSSDA